MHIQLQPTSNHSLPAKHRRINTVNTHPAAADIKSLTYC
jgi:hypothetical protein